MPAIAFPNLREKVQEEAGEWRYQSLIPLMYLFILVEYLRRLLLAFAKSIVTDGTAPGAIGTLVHIPLGLLMLVLSLKEQNNGQTRLAIH